MQEEREGEEYNKIHKLTAWMVSGKGRKSLGARREAFQGTGEDRARGEEKKH